MIPNVVSDTLLSIWPQDICFRELDQERPGHSLPSLVARDNAKCSHTRQ